MTPEEIEAMKAENAKLKADLEAANKKKIEPPPPEKKDDPDLAEKARKEREDNDRRAAEQSRTEKAIQFNLSIDSLVKENADYLPKNIGDILVTAKKENYGSKVEEANAVRAAFIREFFSIQENLDRLTPSQKSTLENFLKLAKNVKEERAEEIYENLFEPALQSLRQIRKAEELERSKHGLGDQSDAEKAYKDRLIRHSKQTLLGKKESA